MISYGEPFTAVKHVSQKFVRVWRRRSRVSSVNKNVSFVIFLIKVVQLFTCWSFYFARRLASVGGRKGTAPPQSVLGMTFGYEPKNPYLQEIRTFAANSSVNNRRSSVVAHRHDSAATSLGFTLPSAKQSQPHGIGKKTKSESLHSYFLFFISNYSI